MYVYLPREVMKYVCEFTMLKNYLKDASAYLALLEFLLVATSSKANLSKLACQKNFSGSILKKLLPL